MGKKKLHSRSTSDIPSYDGVPMYWLSAPNCAEPIKIPDHPNFVILACKTPIPEATSENLPQQYKWTIDSAIAKAKTGTSEPSPLTFSFNLSPKLDIAPESEWKAHGATYNRCPVPKDYPSDSLTQFESLLTPLFDSNTPTICILYSRLGVNRPFFAIASFIAHHLNIPFPQVIEAFKGLQFWSDKAADAMQTRFSCEIKPNPAPEWRKKNEGTPKLGKVQSKISRFISIQKLSKSEAKPEEKQQVTQTLQEAMGQPWPLIDEGATPKWKVSLWNEGSANTVKSSPYLCSFLPKGVRGYLVIIGEGNVFFVDQYGDYYNIKAHASCPANTVASCIWLEDTTRIVCLMIDVFLFGGVVAPTDLESRLSTLCNDICPSIKYDGQAGTEIATMQFVFRSVTGLENLAKLKADKDKFLGKTDFFEFIPCQEAPGNSILLPIEPAVFMRLEINGASKALLLTEDKAPKSLTPAAIYTMPSFDYGSLNHRTCRFSYDPIKEDWKLEEIEGNDPMVSVEEVAELKAYMKRGHTVDAVLKQLAPSE